MYRTNAQSRSLEDALRRSSIPYVIVGGIEFYQRKEVKDILAYLRLLVNPTDDEGFLRIVNVPNRGIGNASLVKLRRYAAAHRLPLLAAASRAGEIEGVGPRVREALSRFASMVKKYTDLRTAMSPGELARALVDEIGILRVLKEEGTAESLGRWENVQELLSALSEFSAEREEATLDLFLQEVSLVADIDRWDASHNAVTLMTLHSAKGLEFPVVFITGLEEGLLPFSAGVPDRQDLEEERRLCYVGITRAMTKLYLSHCGRRYRFGEISYQSPSRFLGEIGEMDSVGVDSRVSSFAVRSERDVVPKPRKKGGDDRFYADEMPDYENDQSLESLRAGRFVEHEMFGRGKVVSVSGTGERKRAVVDFATVGRKMLMVRYARLKPARGGDV
jgi:DNA helicase-2/ATP-dependent DNA helicase PcrA